MDRMLTEVTAFSLLPMLYIIPAIVSAKNSFKLKQVYPSSISCRIRFRLELKKKKKLEVRFAYSELRDFNYCTHFKSERNGVSCSSSSLFFIDFCDYDDDFKLLKYVV